MSNYLRVMVGSSKILAALGVVSLIVAGCTFNSKKQDAGVDAADQIHQGFGPEGEHGERRITFLSYPSCGMDANKNLVVYSDCRRLYLIDVEKETERRLTEEFFNQFTNCAYPSIWNNRIAFDDFEGNEEEGVQYYIAIYDLDKDNGVSLGGNKDRSYPRIYEKEVAWQDHRYQNPNDPDPANRENSEVFMYDLDVGMEKRITNAANHQTRPDIFGNYIVWKDQRDLEQVDIWMYNISTGVETNISNNPSDQTSPTIWEDKVVWADLRNGTGNIKYTYQNLDIYMYTISTGETRQITNEPSDQEFPHIFGRYITWNDMRNGSRPVGGGMPSGADVYLYDLETNQEKRVTWDDANDGGARVIGDKIVWYSVRNGTTALYMKSLGSL